MEDSNAMTIDFLRARLLSERTVSRTARQRADELAQRVAELEQQLRIVSIQRKKAEKATADVLAILETQGISDASEEYYSSSDNDETPHSLKKANGFAKEEESSVSSKQGGNESENFSYPEVDSSRDYGRSLSWKGHKDASRSLEKHKDASIRRRSCLTSVGKPSKHRPGKSCRQIRQSEPRSEASDGISSSQQSNHGNDEVCSGKVCLNSADKQPEMLSDNVEFDKEKAQPQDPDSSLMEDERNAATLLHDECNERGQESNMEEALEHQAQLIGQYEAMEKAQREWEEKFREENSNFALESCDPGNQSDLTEEAEEEPQVLRAPPAVTVPGPEANLEVGDASITQTSPEIHHKHSVLVSRANNGHSMSPNNHEVPPMTLDVPDKPAASHMPNAKGKHESLDFCHQPPPKTSSTGHDPIRRGTPTEQAAPDPHFMASTFHRGESSNALVPHGTAGTLAGVLDSLKQAKMMLRKQITRVPTLDNGACRNTTEPCLLKPELGNKVDIPGGLSGLFRLPSDISLTAASKGYVPGSDTQLSSAGFYPGNRTMLSSNDPSVRNHYQASNPSFRMDDRLVSGQFFGVGPITMSPNLGINPYQDTNANAHSRDRPHPHTMPRIPSNDRTYRPVIASASSTTPEVRRFDPLIHNDNLYTRPRMYRQ